MAIKGYVGRMGSGKTYEVVSEVILGGLRRGRRVVSNIAGLNYDAMRALLIEQGVPEEKIGELVTVEHETVRDPFFWRADFEKAREWEDFRKFLAKVVDKADFQLAEERLAKREFFIQPGDLVALDEIWRFWGGFASKDDDGNRRPPTVMNFFRMHRHFTHPETGVACDVALITQDVLDISRQVRAVVEETYRMEKLTAIGSAKRYRVDIFQGGRTARRPLRSVQKSYDPRYFPLYSSHSQRKEGDAEAREENIDGRGNIFKGALFKVVLPVGLVVFLFAVWSLYGFFHPQPKAIEAKAGQVAPEQGGAVSHAKPVAPEPSSEWRIVGYWDAGGGVHFLLGGEGQGRRVLADPPGYKITSFSAEVVLPSGEPVTSWSGGRGRGGLIDQAAPK